MADPHHVPDLDPFDRLTVGLYRAGIAASALCLAGIAVAYGLRAAMVAPPWWLGPMLLTAVGATAALSATNVHLYDKRVRWVLQGAAPLGLALQAVALAMPETWAAAWPLQVAGVGFGFVTLSGVALKERFCFRIFGLRAVPALLALGLVPVLIDWPLAVPVVLGPAAIVLAWLAVAKLRQPRHFDIGDRRAYQV
jgi:uncharacterized integral membrane protein